MTTQHPFFEFAPNTYELDEFDCASIFLLMGEERALLIDTGVGIGDLKGVVKKITDKPVTLVITHNHLDHTGGCGAFEEMWMHPDDWNGFSMPENAERAKDYAQMISTREHKFYPYRLNEDFPVYTTAPKLLPLQDGQVFDLGGRTVTTYHCPGHSPGEMVLVDHQNRILFVGDACNCNLLLPSNPNSEHYISVAAAGRALKRILEKAGVEYDADKVYNSHHDYRGLGSPLDPRVLPDALRCCEELVAGTANIVEVSDPMDPSGQRKKKVAMRGTTMVSFHPEGILDKA